MSDKGNNPVEFEAARSVAFGSVTSSYVAVGSATSFIARSIVIANTLDAAVWLSFDGTTDDIYVPASTHIMLNLRQVGLHLNSGTTISVKDDGSSPTAGKLVVSVLYGV